jgi:hypothetical protein
VLDAETKIVVQVRKIPTHRKENICISRVSCSIRRITESVNSGNYLICTEGIFLGGKAAKLEADLSIFALPNTEEILSGVPQLFGVLERKKEDCQFTPRATGTLIIMLNL